MALINTKGYAALEVEQTYSRAWELCQQLGQTPQLFSALWGLASFSFIRAKFEQGLALGEQLLTIAERANDPELRIEASLIAGSVHLFYRGDVKAARTHLERVMALYEPELHRAHTFRYGQDPGIGGRLIATAGLWCAGYPDQALQRIREAVALAHECVNPYDQALTYSWGAFLHQYRGEGRLLRAQAEIAIELSTEHGFAFLLPWGRIARGWALTEEGVLEQGVAEIREGIAIERAFGAEFCLPYFLLLLAEAHRKARQVEAGLQTLDETFATVRATGSHLYEAELYRLKGELILQQGTVEGGKWKVDNLQSPAPDPQGETEACFHKAIAIARQQQAKSWELRAAMSLARLWQAQRKRHKARDLLSEIYHWFTEGFDTKDLQEAAALLVALGGTVERTADRRRQTAAEEERQKATQTESLRLKASGQSLPAAPSSLQPTAYNLSRPSELNTHYAARSSCLPQPLSPSLQPLICSVMKVTIGP